MAGKCRAVPCRSGHRRRLVFRAQRVLQAEKKIAIFSKPLARQAMFAADVIFELGDVAELPLAWCMIHQRDDADTIRITEFV